MSTQKTLDIQPEPKPTENRFDRAADRIRKCADEMNITLTEAELTKFAILTCGMMDDAREYAKKVLGGQTVEEKKVSARDSGRV